MKWRHAFGLGVVCVLGACSSTSSPGAPPAADAAAPTTVVFDLTADTTQQQSYYSFPQPSDLRLNAAGAPDYSGFPRIPLITVLDSQVQLASARTGFPCVPVAYFQFTAPMPTLDADTVIPADKSSPILLVDVDPSSPERGTLIPTVATVAPTDGYIVPNVLAVAPRPGFVLAPKRMFAFVVRRELNDGSGQPLGVDPTLALLAGGQTPPVARGAAAATLYAPLFATLQQPSLAIDPGDVAAATVFTTGDVVADTASLAAKVVAKYQAPITGLAVATTPQSGDYDRFCEVVGTITLPQFQEGSAPFAATGGLFQTGSDGLPALQSMLKVPMAISLPKTKPMPAAGFPLVLYFHGSGGVSTEFVDRGPILTPNGPETPGQGPAYVLAPFGFAMAGSALPDNPERVPGAAETEYLQLGNLPSLLGTFTQGVVEQRLFLAALSKLTIPPSVVAGCTGLTLPAGQTAFHFDPTAEFGQGQSMGGMYTNLISAVEPSIRAVVPTGAGGFWTYFILKSSLVQNAVANLALLLGLPVTDPLTFMHPALSMIETGWEAVDPMVSMPRVAKNPLPGSPARPIYEPVGTNDSYFPEVDYDAMSLAYGQKQTGTIQWQTMQDALTLEGLGGLMPYPVSQDLTSANGKTYTGVVIQYQADPITMNGHYVYAQLDQVKYQYGCFLSTMLATGKATVPAPAPLGTPCPM
jgi:hypothetical protein